MEKSTLSSDWRIGERLRLRDLRILQHVIACGSMAKAAAELSISQPAVSQSVAQLEAVLKVRLLDRSPRGVTPTIYGEALLRRGLEAFDALRQGVRDIEFLADPGAGEVVIGASESHIAGGFLAEIIQKLNDLFGGDTTDQDQLVYVNHVLKGKLLESETLRQQATNNTKEQFANSPDLKTELLNAIMGALDAHTLMSTQALNSPGVQSGMKDILLNHAGLYETLRAQPAAG